MSVFIDRVKKRRIELGYSFKKMEELTGVSRSTLQRYEAKADDKVPIGIIPPLAQALDVSIDYLLGIDSNDIPMETYDCLIPLLKEIGYEIEYVSDTDQVVLRWDTGFKVLDVMDVKEIRASILDYSRYKMNQFVREGLEAPKE